MDLYFMSNEFGLFLIGSKGESKFPGIGVRGEGRVTAGKDRLACISDT